MPNITLPVSADDYVTLVRALKEIDRRLQLIEQGMSTEGGVSKADLDKAFNNLASKINAVDRSPGSLDFIDTFRGSGPSHAIGYVPDPGATAGTDRVLREDGTWAGGQQKHGFAVNADGSAKQTISYDKTTRKITVTPVSGSYTVYINGTAFTKTAAEVSGAHAASTGKHYFYYDSAGALQVSTTVWSVLDKTITPVALVYYYTGISDGVCFYECHTADRWLEGHYNLHFTQGTKIISGFALSGYTLNTDSDAGVTFAVDSGVIADEDIKHSLSALADAGPYTIFYRTGASGDWTWTTTDTLPFKAGTYPQWNQLTGGSWTLTDLLGTGGGEWVNYYLCAVPSVTTATQLILIAGQAKYTSLASAEAETLGSLSLGTLPFEEIAPLYRLTFHSRSTYSGTKKAQLQGVTAITSGGASIILGASPTTAASISNVPVGGISSTNVQAAINELDSEKYDKTGGTITGQVEIDNQDNTAVGLTIVTAGGSSVAASPDTISGLQLWYDADAQIYSDTGGTTPQTTDGGTVRSWKDKTNNFLVVDNGAGTGPTLRKAALAGHNYLDFDASNDQLLNLSNNADNYLATSGGNTTFIVWYPPASANVQIPFLFYDGNYRYYVGSPNTTQVRVFNSDGGTDDTVDKTVTKPAWMIQTLYHDGSTLYNGVNDTRASAMGSGTASGGNARGASTNLYIRNFPATAAQTYIAEIIHYNVALSEANRQKVEAYLANKYGITVGYPTISYSTTNIILIKDPSNNEIFKIDKDGKVYVRGALVH